MSTEVISLPSRRIFYLVTTTVLSRGQPLCSCFREHLRTVSDDLKTWLGWVPFASSHTHLQKLDGAWKYNSTTILLCWRRQVCLSRCFNAPTLFHKLKVSCSSNLFVFKKITKCKSNASVSKSKYNTSVAYRTDKRCTNTVWKKMLVFRYTSMQALNNPLISESFIRRLSYKNQKEI